MPESRAAPFDLPSVRQRPHLRLHHYVQAAIGVLLAISLTVVVCSNLVGWTALTPISKLSERCNSGQCQQFVRVLHRGGALAAPANVRVREGDLARLHISCTPECVVTVAGALSRSAGQPAGNASPLAPVTLEETTLSTWLYSRMLLPHLGIVATVQRTLTSLVQVAWLFVIAQIVFPATRRRPKFLSYEMALDLMYVLQTQLLYMTAAGAAIGVSTGWLQSRTPVLFPGLQTLPLWLQVVLALWVYDFVVYWRHRLEHQLFFLWPIHAVHHTTQKVDVFTTTRLHPLELMAGGILNLWITARFGVSAEAASIGFMLYLNYNYYVHTNVRIKYPGFLKYLLVSPFMHRWHHAREDQARDKNFGVIFAWNDWLFGTALHPDREPKAYGIHYPPGERARDSYLAHLAYPLQVLVVRLFKRSRRLATRQLPARGSAT